MKKFGTIAGIIIAMLILLPCVVLAEGGVPEEVVDARASLVRVFSYYIDGDSVIRGSGTGFALGKSGPIEYVVTNHHVIEGSPKEIWVCQTDEIYTEATVYSIEKYADIAILKLDKPLEDLVPVTIEDHAPPKVGHDIYALGYPGAADDLFQEDAFGIEGVTITDGIVSALKHGPLYGRNVDIDTIQINADITHGNSGGPLLNSSGHVVGINTFGSNVASGINGAIHVDELISLMESEGVEYLSADDKAQAQAEAEAEAKVQAEAEAAAAEAEAQAEKDAVADEAQAAIEEAREAKEAAEALAEEMEKRSFPWLIVALAAAAAVITVLIFLLMHRRHNGASLPSAQKRKNKTEKDMPFEKYFSKAGMVTDAKLNTILPVVQQVQALHQQSRFSFDIAPKHITVTDGAASLFVSKANTDGDVVHPGYSAIECYSDGRMKGPWTDVYAMSAVLYTILEGKAPPAAFERNASKPVFAQRPRGKYQPLVDTLEKGMAIAPEQRNTSIDDIVVQLEKAVAGYRHARPAAPSNQTPAAERVFSQSAQQPAVSQSIQSAAPQRPEVQQRSAQQARRWRKAVVIPVITLGALVLMAATLLIYLEVSYANAVAFAEEGKYEKADDSMQGVFMTYKDSEQLDDYIKAMAYLGDGRFERAVCILDKLGDYRNADDLYKQAQYQSAEQLMEDGDYRAAVDMFESLEDYEDADEKMQEARYQAAKQLLDSGDAEAAIAIIEKIDGKDTDSLRTQADLMLVQAWIEQEDFEQAQTLINELVEKGINQAEAMTSEINYQKAKAIYEDGNLEEALASFKALGGYKDADDVVGKIQGDIYNKGIEMLNGKSFQAAQDWFSLITYYKDAEELSEFCDALMLADSVDFSATHYAIMKSHMEYEHIAEYLMKDIAILYFLEGQWQNSDGIRFSITYDDGWWESDNMISISGEFDIRDGILYIDGNKALKLEYINKNNLSVYNYENQKTYVLYR